MVWNAARTSTRFDGTQRSFECPHCDATNYLDQNGEITDPPVSKTCRESTPIRYAASRTSLLPSRSNPAMSSSTSAEDGSVFCKTCLQNQHLFTASLAQYLPDDPDAPDYAEREKKYYRFRKGLEQLYPQICAECEPKVRARLERAAYTAKTDMLRRMIDRTNANRNVKSKGWLDLGVQLVVESAICPVHTRLHEAHPGSPHMLNMLVGGHALALAFTLYMYMLGPGVIRTEVAPFIAGCLRGSICL
ncbi:hypothetical protein P8C59_007254 [Phyllachora maydis]|uniref:Ima1 N-terminal domain-containing protein n=1 Tax=Phyllachora maydis TaxID=1825666 RepID=A0AAD9I9A7_9PEZI|nr:hypothetical protein P8C59_007254 [Phyllachora maydis]